MNKINAFGLLASALILTACNSPKTPDTSMVAGTYHQHDQNNVIIEEKWITLNDNGTWLTGDDDARGANKTFTLNGEEISLYFNNAEIMYGTIINEVMRLQVYVIVGWEEAVFYLDPSI